MRIAITGNLGYIGPVVVEHLARSRPGDELVGIDTGYFASRITDPRATPERFLARQLYRDVRSLNAGDLAGTDAVIHLAALSNDPMSKRYEALTAAINHEGTMQVARAARQAGVKRFVFASSCSVYGAADSDWIDESSPVGPLTPYAASKLASERGLEQLATSGFLVTALRFATAYGWSPRLRLDLALNDFVATAVASGAIALSSSGTAWRPLIHVRDMARALAWGLDRTGEAWVMTNAGATAHNWRIIDLANTVSEMLGGVEVRLPEAAPADQRSYRVDFSRFARLAENHTPQVDLAPAVREMAEGLQRAGFAEPQRAGFIRLAALEALQRDGLLDRDLRWRRPPTPCRLCGAPLDLPMADLGATPLANDYLAPEQAGREPSFPLDVWACRQCWLVQLGHLVPPGDIFSDYAYLSSCSPSWVEHARQYAEQAARRLALGPGSRVVEIASNDGYLLQHFAAAGIPCLGVEPAANVAEIARAKGIHTVTRFFNSTTAAALAEEGWKADLMTANNVLAHVTDLHGFAAGFAQLLKPEGVATFEFPHLLELIRHNQFDTIYHEHYSYFSLIAASRLFAMHNLRVFDVERLATHGGSLRLWVCHDGCASLPTLASVEALLAEEKLAGLDTERPYREFPRQAEHLRESLRALLARLHQEGKRVAAYGAAAKGNTLLNFCGIGADQVDFVADRNPLKQGRLLPGSHIPVVDPAEITARQPDYVLILPWNLTDEIREQLAGVRQWGGKFIRPVPEVEELA